MREIKVRRLDDTNSLKYPRFEYRRDWPYISVGFGDERDYFIENLSLLLSSGMGISATLSAIAASVKTHKMKRIITYVDEGVRVGMPLWKALAATHAFPDRIIALIRSGEEAGRLSEHLNLVTIQQQKDKVFHARIRSALLYPGIVLVLAFGVALTSTWIVLPNLTAIFSESQGTLPLNTRILISLGAFFDAYGVIAVPGILAAIAAIVYFLFFNKRTKFVGDAILLITPGVKALVQGVELGRFGYTFGALLQAGFQITEALISVEEGCSYASYRRFYAHIRTSVMRGESLKSAFSSYANADALIPRPIQQLIIAAEQSGRLPETHMKIGVIFEERTDAMSRDLATVLEPIVLIVVGSIVAFIVSGVLGPIYGLSEQI